MLDRGGERLSVAGCLIGVFAMYWQVERLPSLMIWHSAWEKAS
jgi:hypothetical protein